MKSRLQAHHCLTTKWIVQMTVLSLSSLSFSSKSQSSSINHLSPMNILKSTLTSAKQMNSAIKKMNQLVSKVVTRVSLESMTTSLTLITSREAMKKLSQANSSLQVPSGTLVTLLLS